MRVTYFTFLFVVMYIYIYILTERTTSYLDLEHLLTILSYMTGI